MSSEGGPTKRERLLLRLGERKRETTAEIRGEKERERLPLRLRERERERERWRERVYHETWEKEAREGVTTTESRRERWRDSC